MTKTKAAPIQNVKLEDIEIGDVFSETSHYKFTGVDKMKGHSFLHLESGQTVFLGNPYVEGLLATADQYNTEVMVGREDKLWTEKQVFDAITNGELPTDTKVRAGDIRVKGIRSLFEEIYNSEVFACCYVKQDKPYTKKRLQELRDEQANNFLSVLDKARTAKKGITNSTALEQIYLIQENPILPFEPGEERELRGFKIQFTSRDGRYDCVDMDIDTNKGLNNIRPVNINTLLWLVYKGVKYIVEK